jgi:hypothetical protein
MVWLPAEELHTLDWAEADWPVIKEYRRQFDRTKERNGGRKVSERKRGVKRGIM